MQRELRRQHELQNFTGHIKRPPNGGKLDVAVFGRVTASYLEMSDLLKLLYLSKGIRSSLLKHNSHLYTSRVFSSHIT